MSDIKIRAFQNCLTQFREVDICKACVFQVQFTSKLASLPISAEKNPKNCSEV